MSLETPDNALITRLQMKCGLRWQVLDGYMGETIHRGMPRTIVDKEKDLLILPLHSAVKGFDPLLPYRTCHPCS